MSSPNSLTAIALDPHLVLLLVQDHPKQWAEVTPNVTDIEDINLLTYAWADGAIYGAHGQAITQVRALAKRDRGRLAQFGKRPPRVWVGRTDHDGPGPVMFTSESKDGTVTRAFHVPDVANDKSRQIWPPAG